jgi:hypothetical protein
MVIIKNLIDCLDTSEDLPPKGGALTIGLRAPPGPPGRPGGPDGPGGPGSPEDGPGVTLPPVGVPDLDTGGVDFPPSRGLLDPGVDA